MRISILIYLGICQIGLSQNIVPNGNFEQYSALPSGVGQWNKCDGWNNVNLWPTTQFPYATPDYFHVLGNGGMQLPNSSFGTVSPNSGSAIMGFVTWTQSLPNYREYLSIQLSSPMIIGATYSISFSIANGINPLYGYSSDHIGIRFSSSPLFQLTSEVINTMPQIEIQGEVWDTTWQSYTFNFMVDSAYSHLTIGNFYNDSATSYSMHPNASSASAYYFIDDIEVSSIGLQILGNTTICTGDSITLLAINDTVFSWVDSLSPGVSLSNDSSLIISPTNTTTYFVYGNNDTTSFTVNVNPIPTFSIGNDTALCQGEILTLDATTTNATYLWQNYSTDPTLNVSQQGMYWVEVTVNNCSASDTLNFKINDCASILEIPNIFTPNNDEINDLFAPIISNRIISMHTFIYNRWGSKVFETNNLMIEWNGKGVPDGTYFWIVYYTDIYGTEKRLEGHVTILR